MKIKRIICVGMLLAVIPMLSGCWYLVAGGAGAYGGYKMKEKGYTLRNPVAKEKNSTHRPLNNQYRIIFGESASTRLLAAALRQFAPAS
jgi:hypothetical protein